LLVFKFFDVDEGCFGGDKCLKMSGMYLLDEQRKTSAM